MHKSPIQRTTWQDALTFELPWPPSINTYWRPFMAKQRLINSLSTAGKRYRKEVREIVPPMRLNKPVCVDLSLTMPDRRKRDIDNVIKPLLDALEHAQLMVNDNIVRRLCVTDVGTQKPGGVLVVIRPFEVSNGTYTG